MRGNSTVLRILVIGAHPDDCEMKCAGTAAKWVRKGFKVSFVSATDGSTGHHEMGGGPLARRRIAEARAAAAVIGVESQVLPIPNGQIEPILAYRRMMIRLIREFQPDLLITHRPNDYHPDHRYTSQLLQDSSYLITVPNVAPELPHLAVQPVILYMSDRFKKPTPFAADVVVAIDDVIAAKIDMLHEHESQVYEWLPYNRGVIDSVPKGDEERKRWLLEFVGQHSAEIANRYRKQLEERYGESRGRSVIYAEAYEVCEYGAPFDATQKRRFFEGL